MSLKYYLKKTLSLVVIVSLLLSCSVFPGVCIIPTKALTTEYGEWSEWSEWQDTEVAETDLCNVETQIITVTTYHYYRYSDQIHSTEGSYAQSSSCPNYYTYDFDYELEFNDYIYYRKTYKYWYAQNYYISVFPADQYTTESQKTQYRYRTRSAVNYYTVSYDANGGNNAPSDQMKTEGVDLLLVDSIPEKSFTITLEANGGSIINKTKKANCVFDGWKSTDGVVYNAGELYTKNEDVTLTAQWTNPTVGELEIPTKEGYRFKGWYESATGGTRVTESSVVSNDIVLYARWTNLNENEDIFSYTVENGEVTIDGFVSEIEENISLVIPAYIEGLPVTQIASGAFFNYSCITEISFPATLNVIGSLAFYGNDSIKSVEIPDSVSSIGMKAFYDCNSLTNIELSNSVVSIGTDAFGNCQKLESINVEEDNTVYSSENGVLFNKDKTLLIQYPIAKSDESYVVLETVIGIERSAFSGCENLTRIILPDGLINIEPMAFINCKNLSELSLPDSVAFIGDHALSGCNNLNSIFVGEENTAFSTENGILFNKDKTILIKYPAAKKDEIYEISVSVTKIGSSAFSNCTSLIDISIPDSVTEIGSSAFSNCTSLIDISIPDSVTEIGSSTFYNCTNLSGISIPDSVTEIGSSAFYNCTNLSDISIPDSVIEIGSSAFEYCESLKEITIPSGVCSIEDYTFSNCISLENVVLPQTIISIGQGAFYSCLSLSSVIIPDGVTKIGADAFYWCDSLEKIVLPNGVTEIGSSAFMCTAFEEDESNWVDGLLILNDWLIQIDNNISSVVIPDKVNRMIDLLLFTGGASLESITILNPTLEMNAKAFEYASDITIIGYANSTADVFARENEFEFSYIPTTEFDEYVIAQYGEPLTTDPFFINSKNGIFEYNNAQNGNVTVEKTELENLPTGYSNSLKITATGPATPGLGGFCQQAYCEAGGVYYQVFVAKIPIGYTVNRASNQMGYQVKYTWLTTTKGTGDWQIYVCKMECGIAMPEAPYGYNFGHIYLTGEEPTAEMPLEWYVCYSNIFDATGYVLYWDTNFSASDNRVKVYNNMNNGSVTLSRVAKSADSPDKSNYMIQISVKGDASPGLGGFYQDVIPVEGCTYYHKFCAKIPEGYRLEVKSNWVTKTVTWLTEQYGTGKWETYCYKVEIDKNTDSLGTFGFVALYPNDMESMGTGDIATTQETVTWYISASNIFAEEMSAIANYYTYYAENTVKYNGHLYIRYNSKLTWKQAEEVCRAMGGHLATITSADENAAVLSICSFDSLTGYYIGATDEGTEGNWRWITGETFSYSAWAGGQPDNASWVEHFGSIWSQGEWNDITNAINNYGFICEIEDVSGPTRTIEYNGNIYALYNNPMTWSEAKAFCEKIGGHLVTITDSSEQKAVARLMNFSLYNSVFIGSTDEGSEGSWRWITGESFSYTNWNSGEPNNNGGNGNPQNVGALYKWYDNTWDDGLESSPVGFICEFEMKSVTPVKKVTFNGNHYEFYSNKTTWTTAETFAKDKGGHLVAISSKSENDFIYENMSTTGVDTWLGFRNYEMSGNFKWVTGEAATYTNWNTGEPNNQNGIEYYAHMYSNEPTYKSLWNDAAVTDGSNWGNGFVIEYDNTVMLTLKETNGTVIDNFRVSDNQLLSINEQYVKDNTYVEAWYNDPELSNIWNLEKDLVTGDTVLYAKRAHFVVSFYSDNKLIESKPIYLDEAIGSMPIPTKTGYTFLGWYGTNYEPIRSDYIVYFSDNITLYACWIDSDLLDCGTGLSWTLDGNILRIEGSGEMNDYEKGKSPWSILSNYIASISIGPNVKDIGDNALNGCYRLETLVLSENITQIGEGALDGCHSLSKVEVRNPACVLPETINTKNPDTVFYGYTNSTLNTVANNNSLKFSSIGSYGVYKEGYWLYKKGEQSIVFYGTNVPDLGKAELPWGVATSVNKVYFEDSIRYIGDNALAGFTSVSEIHFPDSLEDIGINALEDTKWYKNKNSDMILVGSLLYAYKGPQNAEIVIGSGIKYIARNLSNSFSVNNNCPEKIQIPNTVIRIGDGALSYADKLTTLSVAKGNSVYKSVNNVIYSKDGRRLVCYPAGKEGAISFSDAITEIGPYAFAGVKTLNELTLDKKVSKISTNAFDDTPLETVYGYFGGYAHEFSLINGYEFVPFKSTVTFDLNDGSGETLISTVNTGCAIGDMYVPSQPGFEFVGWFLESDTEDIKVQADYVVNEDIIVYAYWDAVSEEAPYITGVEMISYPQTNSYFVGDTLSTAGLKLNIVYSDGTIEQVSKGFYCVPTQLNRAGDQRISVAYAGLETEFYVTVHAVEPSAISIERLPNVLTYFTHSSVGDEGILDTKGLLVKVLYNNGTSRLIRNSTVFEYVYDFSVASQSTNVTIEYTENDKSVSTFYQVQVLDSPTVYSTDINGLCGDEIAVPIYISNNIGIMGYSIKLSYDPTVLTPEGLVNGTNTGEILWDYGYGEENAIKIIWCDTAENANDGLLFTVYFKVSSRTEHRETDINISYEKEDTFNENYENVNLNCLSCNVTIKENSTPMIFANDSSVNAGENIDIPILFSNNCGISDLTAVVINYNGSAFTCTEFVENGCADILKSNIKTDKATIFFNEMTSEPQEGCLLTLKLKVADTAIGKYTFSISIDDENWSTENFAINVIGKSKEARVSAEPVSVGNDWSFNVPVLISGNSGLMGYKISLKYDPNIIVFDEITVGGAWQGNFEYNIVKEDQVDIIWNSSENVVGNGLMFTVGLKTKSTAIPGATSLILSYSPDDTYDENWDEVVLTCDDINITVVDRTLLSAVENTISVVDYANKLLYGILPGTQDLYSCFTPTEGYYFSYSEIATNSTVEIMYNDTIVDKYTIVIFGDVNGDGWYDGEDAFLVNLIVNAMLDKDDVGEAIWTAADCNHDGVIDELDVDLLSGAGLLLNKVDQNKPLEELVFNSEFVEYSMLIDQSAGMHTGIIPEPDTNEAEQGTTTPETNGNVEPDEPVTEDDIDFEVIFSNILEFFKKIFAFVFSFIIK